MAPALPAGWTLSILGCQGDADCDDGEFCNGAEICDVGGNCVAGLPVACDDGVGCTADACNEFMDMCVHVPLDSICDDGLFCNGVEACDDLLDCRAANPPDCEEGVACTLDLCDPATDACVHVPDASRCADGEVCNGDEVCDATAGCLAGTAPVCDDGIDCTADACNELVGGCFNEPVDRVCDNGSFCDGVETCDADTGCRLGTPPDCDDGVVCTIDACDEVGDTCTSTGDDAICDDGVFCNGSETCDVLRGCEGGSEPSCGDGVGCTADVCDPALDACVNTPVDDVCDDGVFCNGPERCDVRDGCGPGIAPDLDDGIDCTADSCDDGVDMILHVPVDAVCQDGQFCNGVESCSETEGCQPGASPDFDDGVACTVDTCDEATDTGIHTVDDAFCDDGAFCNGSETCDLNAGCVAGPAVICDDGVGCTTDGCDEATDACTHLAVDAVCDDALFCSGVETCDAVLGCVGGPTPSCDDGVDCTADVCDGISDTCLNIPADPVCDDGVFCNGSETCDVDTGCVAGVPVNCDDGVDCTSDACDEAQGACSLVADDAACDDGSVCTGTETCNPGVGCVTGTALDCDDANPCTDDICDALAGCSSDANTAPCDDADACTTVDVCSAGVCVGSVPPACDDGNPCTDDSCDAIAGCLNLDNNAACDDGNVCTTSDTCSGGTCIGAVPPDCDDGNPCTIDSCDANGGCINTPGTDPCDDGDACTIGDVCSNGMCVGGSVVSCDDGNLCTDDRCDALVGCLNDPNAVACDDGDACTTGDACSNGTCMGGSAVSCDDGNFCTDDACEPSQGCSNTPNAAPCDDGDVCTTQDVCAAGTCTGSAPLDCDDANPCTDDLCDPRAGCANLANTAVCDDGNACTLVDLCAASVCTGSGVAVCDDGDACTADSCDPVSGCGSTAIICDDGDACTVDACDAATGCTADPLDCSLLTDECFIGVCDVNSGVCVAEPSGAEGCGDVSCNVDADCDDGNACTIDVCDPVLDCIVEPVDCGDGDACTTDSCDAATGCVQSPRECDDGDACTTDSCDAATGCVQSPRECDDGDACTTDSCDAATGCVQSPVDCDDGDACTTDSCDAAAGCVQASVGCDDGDACTTDTCDAVTGCAHASVVCEDGDACTSDGCDAATGCVNAPLVCDDGDACTQDLCDALGECMHPVLACDDGLDCTADVCDPASGCVNLPVDAACDDGVDCTLDVCDPPDGCTNLPVDAGCADGLFCNGDETCEPAFGCSGGSPPVCDDGDPCTDDICSDVLATCIQEPALDPPPACEGGCPDGSSTTVDVIDFESLAAGTRTTQTDSAGGAGPIGVVSTNPALGVGVNAAVIYDSACEGGCSGGDDDLGTPNELFGGPGRGAAAASSNDRPLGNVLIVAENLVDGDADGLVDSPDDQANEVVSILFDFSVLSPVTLHSILLIDVDAAEAVPVVELFDVAGVLLGAVPGVHTGDNGVVVVDLGDLPGVTFMTVGLNGSGAVDEISFSYRECTPASQP